jgi:alkanesulfonate monooxygenase SsuD/methylene tetrahydromethanopterin reductase-like flavin-dependent oxidoreductase (luciferase family)
MKKIGFLSFGHWTPSPQSLTRTAADALLQSVDLAVAAEELGADGAYFRVHHFARQLVDRIKRFEPRDSHNSLKLFNVLRTLPFDFDH